MNHPQKRGAVIKRIRNVQKAIRLVFFGGVYWWAGSGGYLGEMNRQRQREIVYGIGDVSNTTKMDTMITSGVYTCVTHKIG